jgi:hypothetical protein
MFKVMSEPDIFEERKFPGCRIPWGRSDWSEVVVDPSWGDSILRVRTIYGGGSAQLTGIIVTQPPSSAMLGVLPAEFRPPRLALFVIRLSGPIAGPPNLAVTAAGAVVALAPGPVSAFRIVYALD